MLSFLRSFLYLFQLLNNWPRALLFVYEEQASNRVAEVPLIVKRPPFDHTNFANSLEELRQVYGKVLVSVCDSPQYKDAVQFTWRASLYSHVVKEWKGRTCDDHFFAPHQGEYTVTVVTEGRDNTTGVGREKILVRDIWIAALGDSFASGEGNPDREMDGNSTAEWISKPCHRSKKSWPYGIFEAVRKRNAQAVIHFSYLACTGATVESGVLGPIGNSQFDVLKAISTQRGMGPDILMLSIGGNDIGYGEILEKLQQRESDKLLSFLDWKFYYVESQLKRVREAVRKISPGQVLLPFYFDFTRNEKGEIDASCAEMHNIRTSDVALAEKVILARLNNLLLKIGHDVGWTVEDRVPSLFRQGGICSKHRLIRSLSDSLSIQGDPLGAFHPTDVAHERIANLLLSRLKPL